VEEEKEPFDVQLGEVRRGSISSVQFAPVSILLADLDQS
jgi:hypothetical protein